MMSNIQREQLSPDNERRLQAIVQNAEPAVSRRATVFLRWHAGVTIGKIAEEIGMSLSGVHHWLKLYRERGLELFDNVELRSADAQPETQPEPIIEAAPVVPPRNKGGRPRKIRPDAAAPVEVAPIPVAQPEPKAAAPVAAAPLVATPIVPPRNKGGRPRKIQPVAEVVQPPPEVLPEPMQPELIPEIPPDVLPEPEIPPTPEIEPDVSPESLPEPIITSVTGLVNYYRVDLKHAQHVAQQALLLFDATAEIHHLPDNTRSLLEAAALLHNVAYERDQAEHHTRGRDIILATPLKGFSDDERRMIALITAFHRKKVHPEREPVYLQLVPELRSDTLALSAILRIADGCDNSQTQTTTIAEVQSQPGELLIVLHGIHAEADADRAAKKADLWERLFKQHVRVRGMSGAAPTRSTLSILPVPREQMPDLVLTLDPTVSGLRAMRRLALHYTDRLDRLATHVRSSDPHRLPAMVREIDRVQGLLSLAAVDRFEGDMRWLSERAYDALVALTLYDRAAQFADDPDDPNAGAIADGLSSWQKTLEAALDGLDFAHYDHMMGELRRELSSDTPDETGTLVNTLIGSIIWTQLTELRDVMDRGESVRDALTATRRLQDYLLYFRSLLGSEAGQALDMLSPFESYLTTIHVVQLMLSTLDPAQQPTRSAGTNTAAEAMRVAQMNVLNELADGLPLAWSAVNSATFRRSLALALAVP